MSGSNLKTLRVMKLDNAKIIKAVFEEMIVALENDYDSIWNGMFITLFRLDGRYVMNEKDTLLIQDASGEVKELVREEIEELLCDKINKIQSMIEKSLKATENGMMLVLEE